MYHLGCCLRVYVKVGSEQYFSECLLKVLTPDQQRQCQAGARVKIPGGCNYCNIPGNCITWCKTQLVRAHHFINPLTLLSLKVT